MTFTAEDIKVIIKHQDGTERELIGFVDGDPTKITVDEKLRERQSWWDSVEESGEVVFVVG